MQQICFATNNLNKLSEIRAAVGNRIKIVSLEEIGCTEELPETHETLEENAAEKAAYVYERYGIDCFADDTGLEVTALDGAPGVYSARYAGLARNSDDNMDLLLKNLQSHSDRSAKFKTVISLVISGKFYAFTGVCEGEIIKEKVGTGGFGYDPIFKPRGFDVTMAQMSKEEKNAISHRGKAVSKLIQFLQSL